MSYILEVCADSVQSAVSAWGRRSRPDRALLRPCDRRALTSPALFKQVRRYTDLKIRTLLRPRFGDFCYDDYEFQTLKEEVEMFRDLGADGVVIGILNPDGTLNMEQMSELTDAAGDVGRHTPPGL